MTLFLKIKIKLSSDMWKEIFLISLFIFYKEIFFYELKKMVYCISDSGSSRITVTFHDHTTNSG